MRRVVRALGRMLGLACDALAVLAVLAGPALALLAWAR